jgi:hypothetical protein
MRHTRGPRSAHPRYPPWQAGGDCVERAALGLAGLAAIVRHRMRHIRGPLSESARIPPPAVAGGGGRIARAALGCARLAAIARLRMRYTLGPPCAYPRCPPWQAGARASHERHWHVLGSLRLQCAGSGTHVGCPARIPPPASIGGGGRVTREALARARLAAIVTRRMLHTLGPPCTHSAAGRGRQGRSPRTSGTGTCSARCDRVAPDAAHTWAIQRTSSYRPWQAGAVASHELHGGCAWLAAIASRRVLRTRGPPNAHPTAGWPQAGAVALHERHGDVLGATCPTCAIAKRTRRDTQCGRLGAAPCRSAC